MIAARCRERAECIIYARTRDKEFRLRTFPRRILATISSRHAYYSDAARIGPPEFLSIRVIRSAR